MSNILSDIGVKTYYVMPTIGQFKVTITPEIDRYTKKLFYYTLNVGGHYDKCVNITIHPPDSSKSKELKLSWAEVQKKNCTINSQVIRGTATVQ